MQDVVYRASDVTLGYGSHVVLQGVNLEVHNGQFWSFLGRNASGKATLLRGGSRRVGGDQPATVEHHHRRPPPGRVGVSGLTVLTSLVLNLKCRSVVLATLEPDMAHVAELRVGLWNGLLSVWLGVVIGFATQRFGHRVRLRQPRPARPDRQEPRPNGPQPVLPGAAHLPRHRRHRLRARQRLRLPTAVACLCALLAGAWLLRAVKPRWKRSRHSLRTAKIRGRFEGFSCAFHLRLRILHPPSPSRAEQRPLHDKLDHFPRTWQNFFSGMRASQSFRLEGTIPATTCRPGGWPSACRKGLERGSKS